MISGHNLVISGFCANLIKIRNRFLRRPSKLDDYRKTIEEKVLEGCSATVRRYARFQILIIDEIGYLPIESVGAKKLFSVFAKSSNIRYTLYKKRSLIMQLNTSLMMVSLAFIRLLLKRY
uniref:ATP-binding protein n=1 Tax=Lentilactobacillus hilgardii TaxID=1588 RepID=UPI00403F9D5C